MYIHDQTNNFCHNRKSCHYSSNTVLYNDIIYLFNESQLTDE